MLIDALAREGFAPTLPARCKPEAESEPRQCHACGWTGKRADTIDLGWCPKCRCPTDKVYVCPECAAPARVSRPAEPEVGLFEAVLACQEHGEFCLDADGKCRFIGEPVSETKGEA